MKKTYEILHNSEVMKKAKESIFADRDNTIAQHKALVLVPAFSRHEEKRADFYQQLMEAEGFESIRDSVNNVYTVIKGSGCGPTLYFTAHLDTVFPMDTPLEIKMNGEKYACPGVGDDTAALSQTLTLLRALKASGIKFKGDLIIGGNVGEEGLGDLYGVKQFFKDHPSGIDGFISVDGFPHSIVYGGTGSYRYEICFSGPGGHSMADFGMPNPIHAMGRAIAKIADVKVPTKPWTTFSCGVVEGGTSVNSIAHDCKFLLDIRSDSKECLDKANEEIMACIKAAVEEENARWAAERDRDNDSPYKPGPGEPAHADRVVSLKIVQVGNRPAGSQPVDLPLIKACAADYEFFGYETGYIPASSTDANVPISLGVPGVTLGGGGMSTGAHSLAEEFDPTGLEQGVYELFILIAALLGVEGLTEPLLPKLEK
ncbi:MAG: M20/M25/M40 family metallo-hydrolase [Firmicutes bacterium]|nr:M20/M25/M40 family metallo-hydrolase [Bacillota bacterium]